MVLVLVPVFKAYQNVTRFALERTHGGELFLAPFYGAAFDICRMRTRVALRTARVLFKSDMYALTIDVLHAVAAQRAHHARRVLWKWKKT